MVERGLAPSREKARGLILAGEVRVNGQLLDKPGSSIAEDAEITIQTRSGPYVSRGGLKLEKAAQDFEIDFQDQVVLDVGASTGGYTDYALQHGAGRVYALDVGYGQLDWKLRNDPRVCTMEKTNIRYVQPDLLGELADIVTIDVSFISLNKVFPAVKNLLKPEGLIVCLVKPQFEAGRERVGKKGVVRDAQVHCDVLLQCIADAEKEGLFCQSLTYSPITGPQGNIEFFLLLNRCRPGLADRETRVNETVSEAHSTLRRK